MKHILDEKKLFGQILTMVSKQFGANCEIVLHDLTREYEHTIIDIRNGHITKRDVGGCGSNLGLEVLRGSTEDNDRFNYVTYTPDGRILRSSSIYIEDDDGEIIGSLCINYDITETVHFENYLKEFNHYEMSQEEVFEQDVNGLLEYLIAQGKELIGKSVDDMNREDKIKFVRFLDNKGAFLITRSADRIGEELCISKFTFYNYLEEARNGRTEKEAMAR